MHVTGHLLARTVLRVGEPTWPYREFGAYLRRLMDEARPRIPDFAELSRLTGINQSLFSRWRSGAVQPGTDSLRKVAAVLDVPAVKLFLASGLTDAEELNLSGQVDLTVLPAEIRDFIALYLDERLTEDQRRYARQTVAYIASGIRAELAKSQVKPSGRRRAG
jgi:transcriptional regulator with XRE-family HTH domain